MALVITNPDGTVRRVIKSHADEVRDKAAAAKTPLQAEVILASLQPRWALQNMVKALSLMALLNTEEENHRLQVAQAAIRYQKSGRLPRQERGG